jgi:hypothetical protein
MRTIRREAGFDDAAERIVGTIELADRALESVEWVLGRARKEDLDAMPQIGVTKSGVTLYAYKTQPIGPKETPVVVYFTCNETTATLNGIRESELDSDSEEV